MMRDTRRLALLAAIAAALVAARARSEQGAGRDDDPARQIRAVLDRQVAEWNKGDMDAFAGYYWRSPEVVFQAGGTRTVGWEAMRERYRRGYEAEGRAMGKLEFRDLEVRALGPDVGYAFGRFHLTMPDGTTPSGLFTVIVRKFPEGWRIVHDHTSAAPASQ